jgi:hypothetical protein
MIHLTPLLYALIALARALLAFMLSSEAWKYRRASVRTAPDQGRPEGRPERSLDQLLLDRLGDDERSSAKETPTIGQVPDRLVDVDVQLRRSCSGENPVHTPVHRFASEGSDALSLGIACRRERVRTSDRIKAIWAVRARFRAFRDRVFSHSSRYQALPERSGRDAKVGRKVGRVDRRVGRVGRTFPRRYPSTLNRPYCRKCRSNAMTSTMRMRCMTTKLIASQSE